MGRVLILSCTQRKRRDSSPLPAVERYDGPTFRVLRRFQKRTLENLDVYILSAKFGLIHHLEIIPYYDQQMTPQRARELQPQIDEALERLFRNFRGRGQAVSQLLLCMGRVYLDALNNLLPPGMPVEQAGGSIGEKLSKLHQWLYEPHSELQFNSRNIAPQGAARLRGIEIAMTSTEVLDIARQSLSNRPRKAVAHHSWYVSVDGERASPKWLVGLLTGLPAGAFHSDEARRVLRQLGIEVRRSQF
jgi:uncharacterized protein DUF6884